MIGMDPRAVTWIVSWNNWWLDFGGAPFTAHTFPG